MPSPTFFCGHDGCYGWGYRHECRIIYGSLVPATNNDPRITPQQALKPTKSPLSYYCSHEECAGRSFKHECCVLEGGRLLPVPAIKPTQAIKSTKSPMQMMLDGSIRCWCGGVQEWCEECKVNFCRGLKHIKHVCKQKVGEIKYFPPYPPPKKPATMAPPSMYPDRSDVINATPNPSKDLTNKEKADLVQAYMKKRNKTEIAVREAAALLMKFNYNKITAHNDIAHKLALRIEHIWKAYEDEDEKRLARIFKHIVKKERDFFPCIKAFVTLYKHSRYDATLYRSAVKSYLNR